ncbi:hypothetical protein [Sphingomonas sanguinis]|uniref:Uncharacterized protein n=1 Tax=Sphingomonas sanguinis TaxID=33051 RepID=A0A147HYY7_9SPHN|nr:hypothetical protein [Sphingomonas sanguinis]KTT70154.1 hypothetical protein NS319_08380 [Sphingomonas sanguinis]
MSETSTRMLIKIEKERPLDLLDLTASLAAVGDEYRRFSGDEKARLYVESITESSVLATLTSMTRDALQAGAPFIPIALDGLAPFLGHWSGLLNGLANYGRGLASDELVSRSDKSSLRNAKNFVAPAVNGNAIQVSGDNNTVTVNQIVITPEIGGDIARNANHLLAGPLPGELRFENEPLRLYQVRDAKAGDLGFIDRFSSKPKRLTFGSDAAKEEILHGDSPFDVFFFVTGLAKTAGGEIASYHIEKIDGITSRDAA